jgi:hypothetical protein
MIRSGITREVTACKSCGSENLAQLAGEVMIHFSGVRNQFKPGVLVFPKLAICLHCGASQFALPEAELKLVKENIAA